MKQAILYILVMSAMLGWVPQLLAEEAPLDLGKEVDEILNDYDEGVNKELAKAQAEIVELRNNAIKDLEKEVKSQTRKGNLKIALAIQEKIDGLNATNPVANVFGNKAVEAKNTYGVVGAWLCEDNETYELRIFGKDGKFENYLSDEKAQKIRLMDSSTYEIGATGLAEVKHPKRKNRFILHTVSAEGNLIIKNGGHQYMGRRLK